VADIRSPRLLYLKGGLLLAVGLIASGLLIAEHPTWKVAMLLAVAVWGSLGRITSPFMSSSIMSMNLKNMPVFSTSCGTC
jgi:hypothetical protein